MVTRRKSLFLLGASALASVGGDGARAQAARALLPNGDSDPMFNEPYVDVDEWRDEPVHHRYVHGGFKGTDARFVFCFPEKAKYQGRFFHYISPVPVPETEVLSSFLGQIAPFAFDSGGYAVGTNQGGRGATASPTGKVDPTIAAYRVSAAAARFSKTIAQQMYGPHRTFGYIFGGSGGAFRTVGAFENTDAWDGAVPFVMGSDMHVPYTYTVRAHATRMLKGKAASIADAVAPGGSGDMHAGLNAEQRAALTEATRFGMPSDLWLWEATGAAGLGAFPILFGTVKAFDPGYFKDFWTVPGYLGANLPKSLLDDRIQHRTKVTRVVYASDPAAAALRPGGDPRPQVDADNAWRNQLRALSPDVPIALELAEAPPAGDLRLGAVVIETGAATGRSLSIAGVKDRYVLLGGSSLFDARTAPGLKSGDEVTIDNSDFLAVQTYHRHQVPPEGFPAWNQFRAADGAPLFPQRPKLLGPQFNMSAAGVLPSARFTGKMILVECLSDFDALPWGADHYRGRVRENLGPRYENQLRVWFLENAVHGDPPRSVTLAVAYAGTVQQALRDVAAWAERGVPPPATTAYRMLDDAQVSIPATAAQRRGVQPVVSLTANGGSRAEVRRGQPVNLVAVIEVPRNTGKVVSAEWDFDGAGDWPLKSEFSPAERVTVTASHAWDKPGTYFVTLRVASQRRGDPRTPFARVENLGRVRVVVS